MKTKRNLNILAVTILILLALFTDILHTAGGTLAFVALFFVLMIFNLAKKIDNKRRQ